MKMKDEPIEVDKELTAPPTFDNPLEALKFYTRENKDPFPKNVVFSKQSEGCFARLKVNEVPYEGVGWDESSSLQKLAVFILYGEYDQDATDLYNYSVRKERGPANFILKEKEVQTHIDTLRLDASHTVSLNSSSDGKRDGSAHSDIGSSVGKKPRMEGWCFRCYVFC